MAQQRTRPAGTKTTDEKPVATAPLHGADLADKILDEIDTILAEEEAFAVNYVQRGGQ